MKRVIIEMINGKPNVVSCSKGVEVIIKAPKRRKLKKVLKTWVYRIKTLGQ